MKVYTLIEDTASAPVFACEHGLSFYIETNGRKLLFDMGKTALFLQNAEALGVSIADVELAFLSHGHYDHGGGLPAFLKENPSAPVYAHRAAFVPHFSDKADGMHDIGLEQSLRGCRRLVLTDGVTRIDDSLLLFSDVTGTDCLPHGNRTLYERDGTDYLPDRFVHEQSLIVREGNTNVLFTGCAHRGVVNICARARELLGCDPDAVIGGMHLFSPGRNQSDPEEAILAVAVRLKQTKSHYYTCHCTGATACALLQQELGTRVHVLSAGSVAEF